MKRAKKALLFVVSLLFTVAGALVAIQLSIVPSGE
ncbi:hypothetical protein MNBD_NITROSPINAE04-2455, partial [hydrothermal vent metagenome]